MTDSRRRKALDRFFRRRLLARAADPRVRATREADRASAETYFRPCAGKMPKEAFELGLATPADVERSLARRWRGTPLDGLANPLVRLALACRDVREKDEVSSFVYEMF